MISFESIFLGKKVIEFFGCNGEKIKEDER
jgi:hypothetical protein